MTSGSNYLLIGQQLDLLAEQPEAADSLTAPGAVLEAGIILSQLEAQSLDSLTAPGEALIGHWASAALEQLEAQSLDSLTAPGDAVSLLQQVSVVEQHELEVETAPRAAWSSVCLLLSQAVRRLRRAAAARVVLSLIHI